MAFWKILFLPCFFFLSPVEAARGTVIGDRISFAIRHMSAQELRAYQMQTLFQKIISLQKKLNITRPSSREWVEILGGAILSVSSIPS